MHVENPYDAKPGDTTQLKFRGTFITITYYGDNRWRDSEDTVYAFNNPVWATDQEVRAGVGCFSVSKDSPINDAAVFHDAAYENPEYQANHSRKEADIVFREQMTQVTQGNWRCLFVNPFFWIVRMVGGMFWENDKTR